ncbi:MAG: Hpt domain-containing protein [Thermoflexales bacterium]|nr:Hpt domain-containing protein [Thermoflexales bacterium]
MVTIFSQLTGLLSASPGNLVYHLLILFVLYAIVVVAVSSGRRYRWNAASVRLVLAGGAVVLGRLALIVAALLASLGIIRPDSVLPPLERFVDVAGLGLLLWAFVLPLDWTPRIWTVLSVVNLFAGLVVYLVFAIGWYNASSDAGLAFNTSLQDWTWSVWALVELGGAALALLLCMNDEWSLVGAAGVVFLVGYLLHLGLGELTPHIAGWVRLANLVAYPVLAAVTLRQAVSMSPLMALARGVPDEPGDPCAPWHAIKACRHVVDTPDFSAALQRAAAAINAVLKAEVAAVGLIPAGQRSVTLVAVQQAGQAPRVGAAFDLDSQAVVQRAVTWQQAVVIAEEAGDDLADLRALLGNPDGSLSIHPLVHEHQVLGLLITGFSKQDKWGKLGRRSLGYLADELATAIFKRRQVEHLTYSLARREASVQQLNEELARLGGQLSEGRSRWDRERVECAQRLQQLESALAQTLQELGSLKQAGRPPAAPAVAQPEAAPLVSQAEAAGYRLQFFEEANKHLDAISGALERLQETPDENTLAHVFRLAHALKRMSAALNYTMLARLFGTLGEAVKRLRAGELRLDAGLLILAQDTVHVSRVLLEDLRAGLTPSVDATPLLERWAPLMAHVASPPPAAAASLSISGPTFQVHVSLSPDCQLKAVRAIVILAQLRRIGKIVACQPEEQLLRTGHVNSEFVITLATNQSAAQVQSLVAAIADVDRVEVH